MRPLKEILLTVVIANWLLFLASSTFLGGSALNGQIVGGQYFLGSHGKLTEVAKAVYTYSFWHGVLFIGVNVLVIAVGFYLQFVRKKPDTN